MGDLLLLEHLKRQSKELSELNGDHVDTISFPVDPCELLRNYVAANKPCVIQGALSGWKAATLWDRDYLRQAAGSCVVTVDYTPNGRGDAITSYTDAEGKQGKCFCTPHEVQLPFAQFVDEYFDRNAARVPYLQHQNSNLTKELPVLLDDIEAELPWAAAAFGCPSELVNLWIGDERSETTFHKDHYENLYAVVRGSKIFHLLPPSDVYRMYLQHQPLAQYKEVDGLLVPVVQQPQQLVSWCPIDPNPKDPAAAAAAYPLFFDPELPRPLRVEVNAGEVLYLPALWYHYVQQRADPKQGWCIAVNCWYDMAFDARYASFKLVEGLAQMLGLAPPDPQPPAADEVEGELDQV